MKTLPHALLYAPTGLSLPDGRHGSLVSFDRMDDSAAGNACSASNAYAVIDTRARVETLRRALADGAVGIALMGGRTGADVQRLAVLLSVAEVEEGLADGSTAILVMTDGILPAPISPQNFAGKSHRLVALAWDQKALTHVLAVNSTHTESGEWTAAFTAARAAVLLTAAAAGVPAYDSISDLDDAPFATACERSRVDGFFGRLATDRAQASVIDMIYGRRASIDVAGQFGRHAP